MINAYNRRHVGAGQTEVTMMFPLGTHKVKLPFGDYRARFAGCQLLSPPIIINIIPGSEEFSTSAPWCLTRASLGTGADALVET